MTTLQTPTPFNDAWLEDGAAVPVTAATVLACLQEVHQLRDRCFPTKVVIVNGVWHYVNEAVFNEIVKLRYQLKEVHRWIKEEVPEELQPSEGVPI